jgi:hypothetical protein
MLADQCESVGVANFERHVIRLIENFVRLPTSVDAWNYSRD